MGRVGDGALLPPDRLQPDLVTGGLGSPRHLVGFQLALEPLNFCRLLLLHLLEVVNCLLLFHYEDSSVGLALSLLGQFKFESLNLTENIAFRINIDILGIVPG